MLTSAFNTAAAGLQATQIAIGIVSQNVANAGAAGYVKRAVTMLPPGPGNSGVAVGTIERVFEDAALKQLRLETSRASFASTKADILSQVDKLYGKPGDPTALDGRLNAFTQALQGLASNPGSVAVRSTALNAASSLTERIRALATNVQDLRTGLESRLGKEVAAANDLLQSIASLNVKAAATSDDAARAGFLDQRDHQITQLSSYLEVRRMAQRDGTVTLTTTSGMVLVDRGAATALAFDGRGVLGPASSLSPDASKRGVGTVSATTPGGSTIDLSPRDGLGSGSIAAALELRDIVLPKAQRRLDDLAFAVAQSLTDKSAVGVQNGGGFELRLNELATIKPGNTITVSVGSGASARSVILVASSFASRELDASQTVDSNAQARTFKIPAAPATALDYANAISAALAAASPGLTATSTAAGVTVAGTAVQSVVATFTVPNSVRDVSGAYPQIPLFVDGGDNTLITGSFNGAPQRIGLAQRLSVNAVLIRDASPIAAAGAGTAASGPSRANFLYDALTSRKQTFSSASGIGDGETSHSATVVSFTRTVIAAEGDAAATARTMDEQQRVALTTAQTWFAKGASVNVDEEMSRLIALQTAYAANARVLTAAREMLDILLRA